MRTSGTLRAVAAALVAMGSMAVTIPASATVIEQTQAFSLGGIAGAANNFVNQTLAFDRFDSSLGELTSVSVDFRGDVAVAFQWLCTIGPCGVVSTNQLTLRLVPDAASLDAALVGAALVNDAPFGTTGNERFSDQFTLSASSASGLLDIARFVNTDPVFSFAAAFIPEVLPSGRIFLEEAVASGTSTLVYEFTPFVVEVAEPRFLAAVGLLAPLFATARQRRRSTKRLAGGPQSGTIGKHD